MLYPRAHVTGRRLPVLLDVYGGPGHQEVVAARSRWLERQWWADAGFAVVIIDNRGTPGVAPSFEKVIHRRMADVVLADQVDALRALADKHPDLDLSRVAVRGWSFGGWLAGAGGAAPAGRLPLRRRRRAGHRLGALRHRVHRALPGPAGGRRRRVRAPLPARALAAEPVRDPAEARPLLLVHGLADDNVVAAHTLRLSAALLAGGRPHAVIPLTGATHMAAGGAAQRLLRLELDFLRRNL